MRVDDVQARGGGQYTYAPWCKTHYHFFPIGNGVIISEVGY